MGMTIQEIDKAMTEVMTSTRSPKNDPKWIAYDLELKEFLDKVFVETDEELYKTNKRLWLQQRLDKVAIKNREDRSYGH